MKKYFRFFVVFLVLSCWLSHVASAQIINVPDPSLAAALRETLGLAPNTPITRQAMQRLTGFEAINRQIRDLTGLEHATQLLVLDLGGNQISDIRPLAGLTQLGALSLAENRIQDVSPLARMAQLEWLFLWTNQIRDIRPLAGMRQLERLSLAENHIQDLSPLARMTQLVELYLSGNQINNVRPLTGLTRLKELWLTNNQISDVGPLVPLRQLEKLIIGNNQISNVGPLTGLTQLRTLELWRNRIRDVRPLTQLTQLRALIIGHNQISDVSSLPRLTQLEVLALNNNQISNIRPLARLTRLTHLFLEVNQISDVSPLSGLTRLRELWLNQNNIRDVSPLAKLVNLEKLLLAGNPIADTSPLASLTKLVEVDVKITIPTPKPVSKVVIPDPNLAAAVRAALGLGPNTSITKQVMQRLTTLDADDFEVKDLTGLEHATRLESFSAFNHRIGDLRPLENLANLRRLDLMGAGQISDLRPLENLTNLRSLDLSGSTQISDFTPLAKLLNLTSLTLFSTNIDNRDLTSIAMLTNLTSLGLGFNKISDISPLAKLTNLTWLSLIDNNISDVTPLAKLTNLTWLAIRDNPIADTSPLASLTKLVEVDIEISIPTPVVHVESSDYPPMYWVDTNNGTLHRLVGTEVEDLVPNVRNATSIAVDVENEKVYWAEKTGNTTGRIRRADLDGSNVQLVKNLTSVPHGVALDPAGGNIYLTNGWGKVQRLNVDGSNFQSNLITGLNTPRGLAIDVAGGKIYWTEKTGWIRRANLDGSHIQNIATGLANPLNIATSADTVYWTEKTGENSGEIRSVNLRGTPNIRKLYSLPQGFLIGIAIDVVENKLYWTTSRGSIGRSNLDGSNIQPDFVTGLRAPGAFVLNVETPVIDPIAFHEQLMDPDSDGGGRWIDLKEQDVSLLSTLKSQVGNTETVIIIVNSTEAEIAHYWVDYEGNEISYGRIAPGAFASQHTYVGHVWLVKDTSGGNLAAFRAVEKTGRALIEVDVEITEPAKLAVDVDNDGVVSVQDLVLVATNFGQAGENPADVNGDGEVNIADLVKVAEALEEAAAAPSLHSQLLQTFTASDVRQWLSESQHLDLTDATMQAGVRFLEQLLAALIPNETLLLSNYPNPFNPETWIPYQLAKPADVTVTIYGVNGHVIRRLFLGHQLAGTYHSKGRAAYWDGKNEWGEPAASGLYFYTLTAGDFTATLKMLIRK